jgi:hypothetical protein
MRRLSLFLFFLPAIVGAQSRDAYTNRWNLIQVSTRADLHVPIELEWRSLWWKRFSHGLKATYFDFTDMKGTIGFPGKYNTLQDRIRFDYSVRGFTIKPGWIYARKLTNRFAFSGGLFGVVTRSWHSIEIQRSDLTRTQTNRYDRDRWGLGLEADGSVALRVGRSFVLSSALIVGLKQVRGNMFNGVINGLDGYGYSPAQGFGFSQVYVMVTVGVGLRL